MLPSNHRQIEYILGSMKFNFEDFKKEIKALDNTCPVSLVYNLPQAQDLDDFKAILDIMLSKRLTELRINFNFQNKECAEYLCGMLEQNKILCSLYVTFMDKYYGYSILESISTLDSLTFLSLKSDYSCNHPIMETIEKYLSEFQKPFEISIPNQNKTFKSFNNFY
ncbi:unnamed protein product [Moneuplotes crassus]|uniref:Uncharacterized protein n=1 Tax=Euplotes crassus TaxID=5936 RepID=A0AAD2DAB5_EUPCR|nr:unnamed protein product [Moneuplotes crassus]